MSSAPDLHRGQKVGKYEILTRLSIGGMAELFLAFTAGPGGFRKFVALKQILPDIKKDESFVKMFLDEARITAALAHAHIGQVYDLGIEEGELYLAMEFISGQNLEQVVKAAKKKETPLPIGFTATSIRDSAVALHYAHNFVDPAGKPSPVIHRDVSPKNVMVTYQGAVKVIDFGIAKAKGRLNRTQVGMVKGTSGYMSPEQVRNQPLDGRSDLFSLGVMLHELLTGQRLFQAPHDAAMMLAIAEANVPDPRELNPEVPAALAEVTLKALAREKEKRFATGKEFARALEAASPGLLYDEEQCAAFIQQLFAEKMEKTRQLLEIASKPVAADDAVIKEVAGAIVSEEGEKTPTPRKPVPARPSNRTPAARARVDDEATIPPIGRSAPVKRPPPASKPAAEDEEGEHTVTNRSKFAAKAQAPTDDEEGEITDPRAKSPSTAVRPKIPTRRDAQAEKGGGGFFKWLLFLLILGGAVGSYFAPGKVGETSRGLVDKAKGYVNKEMAGEPPPPPPEKLSLEEQQLNPAMVALKQKQELEAQEKAAMDKQAAQAAQQLEQMKDAGVAVAEVAKTVPEKKTEDAKKVPTTSGKTDAKTQVKVAAATTKTGTGTAAKKVTDPDKALDPDQVQVLDTRNSKTAKDSGVGWLTLYTVPPAAVFDGDDQLGTTPLTKIPFPVGVYKLRVVDPDGTDRVLSAPIKAGEVTSMKLRVADLPAAK